MKSRIRTQDYNQVSEIVFSQDNFSIQSFKQRLNGIKAPFGIYCLTEGNSPQAPPKANKYARISVEWAFKVVPSPARAGMRSVREEYGENLLKISPGTPFGPRARDLLRIAKQFEIRRDGLRPGQVCGLGVLYYPL